MQAGFRGRGKDGHPVPVSLPLPYDDLTIAEVDILYAKTEAFEQPQAGAAHRHRCEPFHAVQVHQYRLHLQSGQNHRKASRFLRPDDLVEPDKLPAEHKTVKEKDRAQRLVLGRRGDLPVGRQVGQKRLDIGFPHLQGMSNAVEPQEAGDPG